ncbi:hypothetical protein ABNIH4_13521 [Acinetobacter baumannii ABNIH4]|nr:hypothetical protein U476_11010 [Acinetobacter baumannii PKAB07]EGU00357.1 hypothetical protein ABNIH4_13521 [Acinetobacter baumannii ABNIH4]ETY66816.1 hypothetical protein X964_18810 [Acinetobacter baumannii MDR_MMC4]
MTFQFKQVSNRKQILMTRNIYTNKCWIRVGLSKSRLKWRSKALDK